MIGILGGLCLYSTKVYCDLLKARTDSINQVSEDLAKENNVSVDVEKPFVEANAPPNVSIFSTPDTGTSISPHGIGEGTPIKGWWWRGMLLVELLLVAIAAGLMSSSAAGEVYCEGCNRWLTSPRCTGCIPPCARSCWSACGRRIGRPPGIRWWAASWMLRTTAT